jgi:hypothetical protein
MERFEEWFLGGFLPWLFYLSKWVGLLGIFIIISIGLNLITNIKMYELVPAVILGSCFLFYWILESRINRVIYTGLKRHEKAYRESPPDDFRIIIDKIEADIQYDLKNDVLIAYWSDYNYHGFNQMIHKGISRKYYSKAEEIPKLKH